MIALHHDDLDGHCSGAIVHRVFPKCRFVEMDYRKEVPFDQIKKDEQIYIVDFSLQKPGDWEKLFEITSRVCWIDHHESSIAKAPQWVHKKNEGITDTEQCGARLTWNQLLSHQALPHSVELVDQWDRHVYTVKNENEVLNFARGMEVNENGPKDIIWHYILADNPTRLARVQYDGRVVRRYEEKEAVRCLAKAYTLNWGGHKCLIANCTMAGSRLFDAVKKNDHDVYICWNFDGTQYEIHLYSETVKVNDIAVRYGGGGHPGAAGFVCRELPW